MSCINWQDTATCENDRILFDAAMPLRVPKMPSNLGQCYSSQHRPYLLHATMHTPLTRAILNATVRWCIECQMDHETCTCNHRVWMTQSIAYDFDGAGCP